MKDDKNKFSQEDDGCIGCFLIAFLAVSLAGILAALAVI